MREINWRKEIWSIPNLLSLLRIVMIPVYMCIWLRAETTAAYTTAGLLLGASCVTDLLDGQIARRFNMITNLGKVLDPVADKLTQLSLLVCLAFRRSALKYLLIFFFIKEFWQFCALIVSMRRGKVLNGALMSGKISTTVLFSSLGLLFMFPGLSEQVGNTLAVISFAFLLYAFVDYVCAYFGKHKKLYDLE